MTTEKKDCAAIADTYSLTLEELAVACDVQVVWLAARVEADLLGAPAADGGQQRFNGHHLHRVRQLASVEKMFDLNPEAAAFMVDLIEEVRQLRRQQRHLPAGTQSTRRGS